MSFNSKISDNVYGAFELGMTVDFISMTLCDPALTLNTFWGGGGLGGRGGGRVILLVYLFVGLVLETWS